MFSFFDVRILYIICSMPIKTYAPTVSVVVPIFNEERGFKQFHGSLVKVLESLALPDGYEIIYVNDGSTDNTVESARSVTNKSSGKMVELVSLSKNFGKEIATSAGISYSRGEATIMLDGDGQHPPEVIPEFIKSWQKGNKVVVGLRKSNQKEGFIKRYGSKIFYKLFNVVGGMTLEPGSTDFRLIDKSVREQFLQFDERYRITRGIIDWMGFQRAYVDFHAKERLVGKAKYKFSKLFGLAVNSFVSLSMKPLYFIGYVGAALTFLSFLFGLFIIIEQLLLRDPLRLKFTGTAMLSVLLLFMVGIVLSAQGLISVYLSHIHAQTQKRPLFIVDKSLSSNLE